jgi:hypothetical protein
MDADPVSKLDLSSRVTRDQRRPVLHPIRVFTAPVEPAAGEPVDEEEVARIYVARACRGEDTGPAP